MTKLKPARLKLTKSLVDELKFVEKVAEKNMDKTIPIFERIYRGFHEVNKRGMDVKAIYIGQGFRREFNEAIMERCKYQTYGQIREDKFAGIPLFWVVYPHDHFYVAGGFKDEI
jgi:hypothetical protein